MDSLCKKLMLGGSMAAMLAMTVGANAQDAASATENVTVSASRISIKGYEASTPVTVIGSEQLDRDATPILGDEIRQLPQFGGGNSPNNGRNFNDAASGLSGIDTLNLRNLGENRNLILFDSQRVAPSVAQGYVDVGTLPSMVVQRIDVVTGGASAQWGSDAVSGVVNMVIDKTYTGFKSNISYSNTQHADRGVFKAEAMAGTDFFGGRGHTEFAADYSMAPDTLFGTQRSWFRSQALFPCTTLNPSFSGPAGELCRTYNVGSSAVTQGGLITASAKGTSAPADALKGIQFVGPNAQAVPFSFGINSGTTCTQCSGNIYTDTINLKTYATPYHDFHAFNYTSFDITPHLTASIQLNYGQFASEGVSVGKSGPITIKADNAFIPASIQTILTQGGIPSFTLGVSSMNNSDPHNLTMASIPQTVGQNYVQQYRQLMRGVFTLKGDFNLLGENFTWNAYAQNSAVRSRQHDYTNAFGQNYANATDAVVVQATGPNSLGGGNAALATQVTSTLNSLGYAIPAVGTIACRSTLTATQYGITQNSIGQNIVAPGGIGGGCVPLNVFGENVASQAALNYIAPGRINPSIADQNLILMDQSVFAGSMQGTLPWGLADKIAIATGFEYRFQGERNLRDPLQLGLTSTFPSGNFAAFAGHVHVEEGFLELNMPVLKDQIVDSLDLNAAGRMTSYSTSGLVETWKVGLTSQVNQDIKLRTTLSSDIRAPTISDLYSSIAIGGMNLTFPSVSTSFYPQAPTVYHVATVSNGNPLLNPEQATTYSVGLVLTPHWIEGLTLSADWYSIHLHGLIAGFGNSTVIDQCSRGVASFCSSVFFGKGVSSAGAVATQEVDGNGVVGGKAAALGLATFAADCEGCFNLLLGGSFNAQKAMTQGLDFAADYRMDLFDGTLSWHWVGNYYDTRTLESLGVSSPQSGQLKWKFNLSATYDEGPWSGTVQGRYLGANKLNLFGVSGVYADNNDVPEVVYMDLRGSYRLNDRVQFYAAVDNAFNTPPPNIPVVGGNAGSNTGFDMTDSTIYDVLGRDFRVGVRFEF